MDLSEILIFPWLVLPNSQTPGRPPLCASNVIINFISKRKKIVIVIFSVSKPLEYLVNDPSNFLDKICKRLDIFTAGLGNYEGVAKHYGYDFFTRCRFKAYPGGPSNALISAIIAEFPDVTVESFARVVVKQTRRKDVARLLREFDRK